MDQHEAVDSERPLWELLEKTQVVGAQVFLRPRRRRPRHRVEILSIRDPAGRLVVVAADGGGLETSYAIDHFVGVRAIPDHIAEANRSLPAPLGDGERRLECGGVGVDITQNENTHGPFFSGAPIIDEALPCCTPAKKEEKRASPLLAWVD